MRNTLYKSMLKSMLTMLILGLSANGMAQSFIPSVAVPLPTAIPDYARCDEEMVGKYDTKTYKACLDGQKQARYTAEQFALTNGKLHGYLEGFSYAIFHATEANSKNMAEFERGKQALFANGANMQAGIDAGAQKGAQLGADFGSNDALEIWENAFRTGKIPSGKAETYYNKQLPKFELNISSPYEYYVGRITVDKILREDIDETLRKVVVAIPNNQVYLVGQNSFNVWDLWFENGVYEVARYKSGGWIDPVKSFDFWVKHAESIGQYDISSYSNLPSAYTDGVAKVEKEIKNPDGTVEIIKESAVVDLKQIFKDGFLESYRYYMHNNFNKGFHEYLKLGAIAGESVGIQIGKRISYENGYADAYDYQFFIDAEKAYIMSYEQAYAKAFNETFYEYLQNAMLFVANLETIGEVNDGILSPGEQVKFKLTIENRGAKSTADLKLNVSGDISGLIEAKLGSMGSLQTKTFETGYIFRIREGHNVRENISLDFNVQGSNTNGVYFNAKIDIRNQIEALGNATFQNLNTVEGKAMLILPIKNVSTQPASGISAEGIINGQTVASTYLGTLAGLSQHTASIDISGLDPLGLIDGIPLKVQMKANGNWIDGADGEVMIKSQDPIRDITAIYLKSIKEGGYSMVSQEQAESKILGMNGNQVMSARKGINIYKKNAGASIPGQLVLQKANGSFSYNKALNDLAVKMWVVNRKSLPAFLSSKRRYYGKLLGQLTISGNIKRAAKGKV